MFTLRQLEAAYELGVEQAREDIQKQASIGKNTRKALATGALAGIIGTGVTQKVAPYVGKGVGEIVSKARQNINNFNIANNKEQLYKLRTAQELNSKVVKKDFFNRGDDLQYVRNTVKLPKFTPGTAGKIAKPFSDVSSLVKSNKIGYGQTRVLDDLPIYKDIYK